MGKKRIGGSVSIAANTTNNNVLSDTRFENIMKYGIVSLYGTASATGLQLSFYAGDRNSVERSLVSAQNRVPLVPDDLVVNDVEAAPGEKLQLQVENTTGAAITFFYTLEFDDDVEFVG